MTLLKLTLRSMWFYRKAHALVLAGSLLATAILVGALLVGDSIQFSLRQSALLRLGAMECSMETRGRFFAADLANRMSLETGAKITPALLFNGMALCPQTAGMQARQINDVKILGVEDLFWGFASGPKPVLTPAGIAINKKLAMELQLRQGDPISIRFSKPALMSRDAPLASQDRNDTIRGTFTVEAIIQDDQLGRFNLVANQQIPCTVFVSLPWLQQAAGVEQKANLLLAGGNTHPSAEFLNQALRKVWQLPDAGLTLKTAKDGRLIQLECDRIFMDPVICTALSNVPESAGALTYLVNSISHTNTHPVRETPYSFVIALSPSPDETLGLVPPEMADNEIIINRWLADQLAANPGDTVLISYFEFKALNTFTETNRIFKIRRIAEMSEFAEERTLSPDFPGLTDAGKCAEWDIGIPLQKSKIEDPANESYWNDFRATPKAIVTLKAGQEMWANRFGNLTAARFRSLAGETGAITESLLQHLNPGELGLAFLPTRQTALKAAAEGMDFGQLFLGLSFFLIVASLMLTGLLFAFGIQQRSEETGLMLALGFSAWQVRRLWIHEGILLAAIGSIVGALLGSLFTHAMIWGLCHIWQGAVAHAEIQFHATRTTMITGILLSFIFAMISLMLAVRRQTAKSTQALLSGEPTPIPSSGSPSIAKAKAWKYPGPAWIKGGAMTGLVIALGLIGYTYVAKPHNLAFVFFTAGSLLLISCLGGARLLLNRIAYSTRRLTPFTLGLRNAGRQPSRSLTVASLLACGCFLIIAVSSMQENVAHNARQRDSGTGGFTLFGSSTLPIQADLNSPEGRKRFGLDLNPALKATRIVSMKVRDGDEASCLNLNRAQSPTLIGVDPAEFQNRGAFQSPKLHPPLWSVLEEPLPDRVIPGLVGDANTAQWGLKKNVGIKRGDILDYRDERGKPFRVKLVGSLPMNISVFQGSILISAQAFASHFPTENGSRQFLIDTPPGTEQQIRAALINKLEKWGFTLSSTTERLQSFYVVESSYMAMFLLLGGLGMLLGSAGMTLVILRNIQERRDELALMMATGYSLREILKVVLAEYGLILGIGLASGLTASLAAIWPGLQSPGSDLPWTAMILIVCGMLGFQIVWVLTAVWLALRAPLLDSLRNQ